MIELFALSLLAFCNSSGPPGGEPIPPGAEAAVGQAKKDLAARQGVDENSVAVVGVEPVDWPDTSLGCPEPGMMYAQVVTPGYKIHLSCGKERYTYHSDRGTQVVFCGSETKEP